MPLPSRPGFRIAACALAAGATLSLLAVAAQGPAGGGAPGAPGAGQGPRGGAGGPGGGQRGGAGGGRGQGPAREAAQQALQAGTGSIAGVVTLSGTGTPVRHAQVTLSGGGRGGRSITTTDQGRFSFIALPAGRFTLNVSKPGYVAIAFGAKKPGRQGTPIQLAEGQAITNANIALPKGGVLTGIVVDEFSEPSPNTPVRAYRFVMQSGQKTLQNAGQAQTDDRGIYRIFQLQPGDYLVSAVPRNANIGDFGQQIQAQLEPLLQQVQAAGGLGAVGLGGGGGALAGALGNLAGGGRGQALLDQIQQLQQQLAQQPEQAVAYAPVYYPGTVTPSQASKITLGIGEEHGAVDFQLQLVPTAKVRGHVVTPDGSSPVGAQVTLQTAGQQDMPVVPGVGMSTTRVGQDASFAFQNITPGQYTLIVRAPVRQTDPNAPQPQADAALAGGRAGRAFGPGGPGGRGGPGVITQVLWASTELTIDGRDVPDVSLNLQPGMTISGRVAFDGAGTQPPADLTTVRVNLRPLDNQPGMPGANGTQVDATGNFTITGVPPGRYAVNGVVAGGRGAAAGGAAGGVLPGRAAGAGGAGGGWSVKSALAGGQDALDFPLDIKPNGTVSGMLLTFTDRTQELSGTLQNALGQPTSDYTIVLFPADTRYWTPQSRRILSTRPSTAGSFTFRGFPAGQYRLTAVTDAEPGEWFDPAFLSQVVSASMTLTIAEGEKRTQDLRLATSGG